MSGTTDDRSDLRLTHGVDETPRPQAEVYLVLSDEERAKGFVRPVRRSHLVTGPQGHTPVPAKRRSADQARADAEQREREAREARWAAAGCVPLAPEPTAVTAAHDRETSQAIRVWAWANDIRCPAKGPLPRAVVEAYNAAKEII